MYESERIVNESERSKTVILAESRWFKSGVVKDPKLMMEENYFIFDRPFYIQKTVQFSPFESFTSCHQYCPL